MKKAALVFVLASTAAAFAAGQGVRKAGLGGPILPPDRARLSADIDDFLSAAAPPAVSGRYRALIVPHAGYAYSGRTAAFGYKLVHGKTYRDGRHPRAVPSGRLRGRLDLARRRVRDPARNRRGRRDGRPRLDEILRLRLRPRRPRRRTFRRSPGPVRSEGLSGSEDRPGRHGAAVRDDGPASGRRRCPTSPPRRRILVVASTDMSHFLDKKSANTLDASTIELVAGLKTGPTPAGVQASRRQPHVRRRRRSGPSPRRPESGATQGRRS